MGGFQPRIVEEFQPRISKKEKKDSGRHFGWPFWPMQAGPGRPPRPGGEEAAAGQELFFVYLHVVIDQYHGNLVLLCRSIAATPRP